MKRIVQVTLLVVSLAMAASIASAHEATARADRREARQQVRIGRGVAGGTLTPRETRRLERGQMRVRCIERRAKADGDVTRRERVRLERFQDRQSHRIHRLKHNGRSA